MSARELAMAAEPENQTGNGVGVVVGRENDLPAERGKAAYRAKADRETNCEDMRGAQSARPKHIAGNT